MIRYEYVPVRGDAQHGHIQVYRGDVLLATKEVWFSLAEMGGEQQLRRMAEQANVREPGRMIPPNDPRLSTHCQWCGELVDRDAGQEAAWDRGQWHTPACYDQLFSLCRNCGQRTKTMARCWQCGRDPRKEAFSSETGRD